MLEDDLLEDDGNTISKIVFENETAPETEVGNLIISKTVTGGVTKEEAEGALTFTIQNDSRQERESGKERQLRHKTEQVG